jgi:hypothetical protein
VATSPEQLGQKKPNQNSSGEAGGSGSSTSFGTRRGLWQLGQVVSVPADLAGDSSSRLQVGQEWWTAYTDVLLPHAGHTTVALVRPVADSITEWQCWQACPEVSSGAGRGGGPSSSSAGG